MKDTIIVGAGAAGISAALYCASRGMDFLLLESNELGGLISRVSSVTHYEGVIAGDTGKDYIARCKAQLDAAGIEVINECVKSLDLSGELKKVRTENAEYEAKTLIVANGTTPVKIGAKGEDELGRVFYEAMKNKSFAEGKEIVMVGSSDGAAKEAIYLSSIAEKVHMVFLEDALICINEFKSVIESKSNIVLHPKSSVIEVKDSDEILIKNNDTEVQSDIVATAVFVFAGSKPNIDLFDGQLDLEGGYVKTDLNMMSSVAGVYACGDVRAKKVRQVATAVSDGAIAALSAFAYCKNKA